MTIREHAEAIERESLQKHPVWFVARQHARAIIDALDACGFVNYGPLSQPPEKQARYAAMMERQGIGTQATISEHVLRLEERVAELEGDDDGE